MNPYFQEGVPALIVVAGLSAFLLIQLGPIARSIGLVDRPSKRKIHNNEIPVIGGITIYLSFLLALTLAPFGLADHRILILSTGVLMIMGVLDDHNDIKPKTKIVVQIIAAILLVYVGDVVVPSVGDIFAWHDGNEQGLGMFSRPFSVFAIVAAINAFNMIDGHDGLASGIFLMTTAALISYCSVTGNWKMQFTLLLLFVPVGIFFLFNMGIWIKKAHQSFLGDAGSMLLGLVIAYFLISLTNEGGTNLRRAQVPWILGLPMFDMCAVLLDRFRSRGSLVMADRKHIHHLLLLMGVSRESVLLTLLFIHLVLNSVGLLGGWFNLPDWILFWSIFPTLLGYLFLRQILCARARDQSLLSEE